MVAPLYDEVGLTMPHEGITALAVENLLPTDVTDAQLPSSVYLNRISYHGKNDFRLIKKQYWFAASGWVEKQGA